MGALNMIYLLKEGVVPTYWYLCANVDKVKLDDGRVVSSSNCVAYLKRAIYNIYNSLVVDNTALKNYGNGKISYLSIFRIELDIT